MDSIARFLPTCAIVLVLLCCSFLSVPAARCEENTDWELVRSMTDTFDGPDVGDTWGQLLLTGIDFADPKRGVISGFNDATEIRHNGRTEGMVGYTEDGGRTFHTIKTKSNMWTAHHAGGDTFYVAGVGQLMRSDDAGKTWKNIGGGGGSRPPSQLDFADPDHGVLAIGKLCSTEDGKTVKKLEHPAQVLHGVSMGEGGFGAAAGRHGDILVTNDGGKTWKRLDGWRTDDKNKMANWFTNAAAVGKTHAWYVGDNGAVVRTTDGGKTFDIQHLPSLVPGVGGEFLTATRFADAKHGWALGTHYLYKTDDGGETWQMQQTAGGVNMYGMSILDANTAWITGHYGVVQHTTDGGKNWQTLNDYTDLYAVAMVDDKIGYAGAESGGMLKTEDGGRTWSFIPSLRGSAVEAIQFLNADIGWVVGDWGHTAATTDGGKTWHRGETDFYGILKDLHFFDKQRGLAVGERGAIVSTTDGGATWKQIESPTTEMLYAVDFPTPQTGYACGKAVVLKTTDGGESWGTLKSPTDLDILSDVRFTDESRGVMVGDIGMIFLTADGGDTWRRAGSPTIEWLHRIEVVDDKTFLVAGSRGNILRSSDGGESWEKMPCGTRDNVYCISRGVAVGRWGQIQLLDPAIDIKKPMPDDLAVVPQNLMPEQVWNRPPEDTARGSFKLDEKGCLTGVTVNGRTFPTNKQFPTFKILVFKDGLPSKVKTVGPGDESWEIMPTDGEIDEQAFIFDSDLITIRMSYKSKSDRLVVTASVVQEKESSLVGISTGDGKFLRLIGDSPEALRRGALTVPVDGGELIPFTGFTSDRPELQKWNNLHGWYFKNRMVAFTDGVGGVILRSHQWHAVFTYGQSHFTGIPLPTRYLYLGWGFDTRRGGTWNMQQGIDKGWWAGGAPDWMTAKMPVTTFGFDIQYVGDTNGDGDVNWVDAGVTYRDGNFPRSAMIDEQPAMCGNANQTQVSFNYGYILWSTPYSGNTHSDMRAHRHGDDGRPALEWGDFSRSVPYETASGRMARYFDKQADECNFPPMPAHIGADTWTCGLGGGDSTPGHSHTGEEGTLAKIEVLLMLGRRGYLTHSEALSEWGLEGNYFYGWWTPYVGGGAWALGFSRCWEYSPTGGYGRGSGPLRAHFFSKPIPLQAVIFQGMTYYGTGAWGPPSYSILHGCQPQPHDFPGVHGKAFFYYPWMVLWKMVSTHRVMNVRSPQPDLWELTYDDDSVLDLDVRTNSWVYTKDGIVYDGYSPPNPYTDAVMHPPAFGWGIPNSNEYAKLFSKGSFGVWRNGTFTIKVPGIKAVKPPRVAGIKKDSKKKPQVGSPSDAPAIPAYETKYKNGVLTIKIKDKDPKAHPILIFEPEDPM